MNPEVVVPSEWLVPRLGDPSVVVADVRWYLDGRSGYAAFESGRLPGAVFVDLDRDLAALVRGGAAGRHPLPSTAAFGAAMGELGIGDDVMVVAYDDTGGMSAARLIWMLRTCGHAQAALLDGGLAAWPGELEAGRRRRPVAAVLTVPEQWPSDRVAAADELAGEGVTLLDARAPERYRGEVEPIDARPGHIPGARNAPWSANLDPGGRLLPPDTLRRHYESLGAGRDADTIAYCGSGVSACVDLLAREHAGLGAGRLFAPSWSGWSADPANPAALDDEPFDHSRSPGDHE